MNYLGYILCACAFVLCISFVESDTCPERKKVVCYYASWSIYRVGVAGMDTTYIDPNLCTHVVYTFAGLKILENKIYSLDPWNDFEDNGGKNSYKKFVQLKEKNPCLKTLLAIGGWSEDPKKYSVMAYTAESRKEFSTSVLRYLVHYGFDGIDMDWEYPAFRGGISADKTNFVELLAELKTQLEPWNLLVTVAVAVTEDIVDQAYDIAAIANHVDYISIMAYDFTSSDSKTTGLLAPLEPISTSINYWLQHGCPAEKLILGIPMYARAFKLENPKNTTIGAPTTENDMKGKFTGEIGFLSKFELEEIFLRYKYDTPKSCEKQQNCYATNGTYWITYDTEDTIKAKVKYALSKKLGGMMAWSIDTDDFQGLFSNNRYPLLQAINDGLYNKNN